jgi:hypothetical protein
MGYSGYYQGLYVLLEVHKQYDVYTTLKSLRCPIPHKEGCFGCSLGGCYVGMHRVLHLTRVQYTCMGGGGDLHILGFRYVLLKGHKTYHASGTHIPPW